MVQTLSSTIQHMLNQSQDSLDGDIQAAHRDGDYMQKIYTDYVSPALSQDEGEVIDLFSCWRSCTATDHAGERCFKMHSPDLVEHTST